MCGIYRFSGTTINDDSMILFYLCLLLFSVLFCVSFIVSDSPCFIQSCRLKRNGQLTLFSGLGLSRVCTCLCSNRKAFFFLEAFCDISHRLGGINPYGVFSDAFPGLKMWVTFACATAKFSTHFIISIAVLENVPPDAGLQKRATFPH
jgi:hypothetical protein